MCIEDGRRSNKLFTAAPVAAAAAAAAAASFAFKFVLYNKDEWLFYLNKTKNVFLLKYVEMCYQKVKYYTL